MASGHVNRTQRPNTSMDSPACARGNCVWNGRLPAVIYPVSIDPDGFRGTTPNHLTLSKTSDVFVGFGHSSVQPICHHLYCLRSSLDVSGRSLTRHEHADDRTHTRSSSTPTLRVHSC